MKRIRRGCQVGLVVFAILAGALLLSEPGRAFRDLWSRGIVQNAVVPVAKVAYAGDTVANLRAIRTALLLQHDSEGTFPLGVRWMDVIEPRLQTNELTAEEARKKLHRPGAAAYGYALNARAAGKYRDDIGSASTILVFETDGPGRNACGAPETGIPNGKAITIAGEIVDLPPKR